MKVETKLYFYEGEERFFGEGPYRLLRGIGETGSLRAAAAEMSLSYSKALGMVQRAERSLGFPLTEKQIGGRGGGGSRLTPKAEIFLKKYEAYREACDAVNRNLYLEYFSEEREEAPHSDR